MIIFTARPVTSSAVLTVVIIIAFVLVSVQETSSTPSFLGKHSKKFSMLRKNLRYQADLKCGQHLESRRKYRLNNHVDLGEFPFLVSIQVKNEADKIINCAGTLISSNKILTSMKCLNSSATHYVPKISVMRAGGKKYDKGLLVTQSAVDFWPVSNHTFNCCHGISEYGFALITIKEELDFTLNPYTDKLLNINQICMLEDIDKTHIQKKDSVKPFITVGWFPEDSCAKKFDLKQASCVEPHDDGEEVCYKLVNEDPLTTFYADLQEGAPLVHKFSHRWYLFGIHTKLGDLWLDCEEKHNQTVANFIPITNTFEGIYSQESKSFSEFLG